jgi:SAM-dependent methyltransferase
MIHIVGSRPTEYSASFFEALQEGALRSAYGVVPLVIEILQPRSVVDLGCGTGAWLSVFKEYGVEDILGIDGEYVDRESLLIPHEQFVAQDLAQPVQLDRRFDLAMSLEVAEHLATESADVLIDSLAALAAAVLFSAAIPEQDGAHHVNTQWPHYWRERFKARGFELVDCIRPQIWENDQVDFWYRQNTLVFARPDVIDASATLRAEVRVRRPLDLVHPAHWSQVTYQSRLDRAELAHRETLPGASDALRRRVAGVGRRVVRLLRRTPNV